MLHIIKTAPVYFYKFYWLRGWKSYLKEHCKISAILESSLYVSLSRSKRPYRFCGVMPSRFASCARVIPRSAHKALICL